MSRSIESRSCCELLRTGNRVSIGPDSCFCQDQELPPFSGGSFRVDENEKYRFALEGAAGVPQPFDSTQKTRVVIVAAITHMEGRRNRTGRWSRERAVR
jgi:hypothetical protein